MPSEHDSQDRPEPWEMQSTETALSFEAFTTYRDLGPRRNVSKTAKLIGKANQTLYIWSAQHNWVERAKAWDAEQDRLKREHHVKQVQAMNERHVNLARALQGKIAQRISTIEPTDFEAKDLVGMLDRLVKIERTALGEPESFEEVHHDVAASDPRERLSRLLDRLADASAETDVAPKSGS